MPQDRYRRFSWLSDWRGIKSAIGELKGWGYPPQPRLNRDRHPAGGESLDEAWFIRTITDKLATHPALSLEFPFAGQRIFEAPLIGFVRGETYDVYTASGEWIGNLFHDGRIIRKRNASRPPLVKDPPPKQPKPAKFPARAPLPPQNGELGFDKIDVLEWDPDVFKRLSDLTPDAD